MRLAGERAEARCCHKFAGAIGAAKNPTSHSEYEMDGAKVARLILFAGYLVSSVGGDNRRLSGLVSPVLSSRSGIF